MTRTLGFIGVGHLADYMVQGFCRSGHDLDIVLSPRSRDRAVRLAGQHGCHVAHDNQDVVDRSDTVIISTRSGDVCSVLEGLSFRPEHLVISVAAGVGYETLARHAFPATVVCALPISCSAINQSPTLLYPAQEKACDLIQLLGPAVVLQEEAQFVTASTYSAFYGWCFKFLDEMAAWGEGAGLSRDVARSLVQQIFKGAAGMAALEPGRPLEDIVASLATPGGITEQGLKIFQETAPFDAWRQALDAVQERLSRDAERRS